MFHLEALCCPRKRNGVMVELLVGQRIMGRLRKTGRSARKVIPLTMMT